MRQYSVPATATVAVAAEENLTDMVRANAERFGDAVSFRKRVDGHWVDVTARDFGEHVRTVAKGLIAVGLQPGDRVALLASSRYEWSLLDFAIWSAGCVPVPVYETSSAEQVEWVLADSGAKAIVVETAAHRRVVESVVDRLAEVVRVWQLDADPDGTGGAPAVDELAALGARIPDVAAEERRLGVRAEDTATLVYTSGTTGRPKGVELTHRNLLTEVRAALAAFPQLLRPGNSMLVFLPLAHVFARAISVCCVYARTTLGHLPDTKDLVTDLGTFRPTFIVAVPRVLEKVYNSARQKAHADGSGRVFDLAESLAVRYSRSLDSGGPGMALLTQHAVARRLVYAKIKGALGGRCVAAVSGSAPLDERLAYFFRGIGVPVYEGYGLTETSAAITTNTRQGFRVGTVGRPIPGAEVRIADDGEVLLRSDVVFRGYWRNEQATEDALREGWLHTGDLGSLDEDGYLRITGRKKELIVTAAGKDVAPALLEDRVRRHPLVSQCLVTGDRQPYLAALLTLDTDYLPGWLAEQGKPADRAPADLVDDADLLAELQTAVDNANAAVSRAESIQRFRVLPADFTEADGELTPSMKLRREVVAKNHAQDIADLYEL